MPVYVLAFLYFSISVILFLTTRKKYTGLFHFSLLLGLVPYVIRPILSESFDNWTIYQSKFHLGEDNYFNIYLTAIIFNLAFFTGYLCKMIFGEKHFANYAIEKKISIKSFPKPYFAISVIIILIIYMFMISGVNWLGAFRQTSASIVSPAFRYIYPILIFASFYLALNAYFSSIKGNVQNKFFLAFSLFLIFITITLLNTRGWFISIISLIFCLHFSQNKISIKALISLSFLVIFVVFFMRNIVGMIFGVGQNSGTGSISDFILSKLLYTASGDIIDVWHIVFDYIYDNGYSYGGTLLGNVLLLFPSFIREGLHVQPALDLVNNYYYGALYYESNFGFNINIRQELFLNFQYFAIFPIILTGYLYRLIESKIFFIRDINIKSIFRICFYVQILNVLSGSLSFTSWLIVFMVLSVIATEIWKILPKKPQRQ